MHNQGHVTDPVRRKGVAGEGGCVFCTSVQEAVRALALAPFVHEL